MAKWPAKQIICLNLSTGLKKYLREAFAGNVKGYLKSFTRQSGLRGAFDTLEYNIQNKTKINKRQVLMQLPIMNTCRPTACARSISFQRNNDDTACF